MTGLRCSCRPTSVSPLRALCRGVLAGLVTRMTRMGKEDVREMNTPVSVGYSLLSEQLADEAVEGNDE